MIALLGPALVASILVHATAKAKPGQDDWIVKSECLGPEPGGIIDPPPPASTPARDAEPSFWDRAGFGMVLESPESPLGRLLIPETSLPQEAAAAFFEYAGADREIGREQNSGFTEGHHWGSIRREECPKYTAMVDARLRARRRFLQLVRGDAGVLNRWCEEARAVHAIRMWAFHDLGERVRLARNSGQPASWPRIETVEDVRRLIRTSPKAEAMLTEALLRAGTGEIRVLTERILLDKFLLIRHQGASASDDPVNARATVDVIEVVHRRAALLAAKRAS